MSDNIPTKDSRENNDSVRIDITRDPQRTQELDTAFDCLRFARSRHLLYYLYEKDETIVSVEEAVGALQEYEVATAGTNVLPSRQLIRLDLVNSHLPRLKAAGVLIHDPKRGEIQFGGNPLVEEWLEQSRKFELY